MNDALTACFRLYLVVVGLVLLALLLGFPGDVANIAVTFVTVVYLLVFAWLVKVPFPAKLLPVFAAVMLAADGVTGDHAFIATLLFVLMLVVFIKTTRP